MADEGLSKFELMQRKMAEKQRKREAARKGGGGGGGAKKKKKKPKPPSDDDNSGGDDNAGSGSGGDDNSGGGGGGGGASSNKRLSKFELMQLRMAEKAKKREEAKKKGGGGGGSSKKSSGSGGNDDEPKGSVHRKAMTTKINMNAVREMDAKNDSESEEEDRNEPYNRIGSRRETAKKNAKLRKYRDQIEVLPSGSRHTMDRSLDKGDAVIFYSRADKQYIPGIVDSIQKSGRETFYKLEKKYKSSFDPVYESKRLGKKVTMDDDPDRYRRTDKPALIKKDTYYAILTNKDFDIELRLALLRMFRDKLKTNLAKHKKKAAKKKRINAIVSTYGASGGAQLGVNYDEDAVNSALKKDDNKPKMNKSKTTMKVTNTDSNKKSKKKSNNNDDNNDHDSKKNKKTSLNVSNNSKKSKRAKSSANLPKISKEESEPVQSKKHRKSKDRTDTQSRKSKSPKPSKRSSHKNQNSNDNNNNDDDDDNDNNHSSSSKKKNRKSTVTESKSKNKSSSKSKSSKKNKGMGNAMQFFPTNDVHDWNVGDISKWLMYLSNSPFVPPDDDDDDSDADFFDDDELDAMAKRKPNLFDNYFQYFVAAKIDGESLLSLNKKSLAKTCKVKNSSDRALLYMAIQDLKNGKVGQAASNSGSDNSDNNDDNNDNDDEKDDGWKPLKKFSHNDKPAKMKKTKTVMSTVNTKEDHRPMTARKEVALRVGGGGHKSSNRGPSRNRPISARKDNQRGGGARRKFHDSDDDLDDSDENIDSESDDDDDEPLTYKMMNNKNKNNKNAPVNDSMSLTRKLGGWDSDSD